MIFSPKIDVEAPLSKYKLHFQVIHAAMLVLVFDVMLSMY